MRAFIGTAGPRCFQPLPWGHRSVQFLDPEGTIVSLFMPVTDAAKARFGSR